MSSFRFIVGIDLGTSSCALSYVDRYADEAAPKTLAITQWQSQGLIESDTLPSFTYIPKSKEAEQFKLDFASSANPYVVGSLARERLISHPDLVVHSAKSWLCHSGVDREANILPWHSDTLIGDKRLSPVFVSSLYLRHLKDVWNKSIAHGREDFQLEKQKIIVTVPASFDELASYLTLEACKLAGLGEDLSLCEEPQAAFYYCLSKESLPLGKDKKILVVDIGGGTSDFCLFKSEEDLTLQRIAVSEHILLGGDNIDLALAHLAEKKFQAQGLPKFSGEKWAHLVAECRALKESSIGRRSFVGDLSTSLEMTRVYHLTLQSTSGSKLLGQTRTIEFTHQEISDTVVEAFFPLCKKDEYPQVNDSALKEWGLPYAEDVAVSKHLAAFLKGQSVDYVLYTGGTLIPPLLRERLTQILSQWQVNPVQVLENDALELAVSRGASVYGYKQYRKDVQVRSAYPRSLYVKVFHAEKQSPSLLCVVPKGFQSLDKIEVSVPGLHALLGQMARFELYSSLQRPEDKAGDFVEYDETMKSVSVLQTRLGEAVPGSRGISNESVPRHPERSRGISYKVPVILQMKVASSGLVELSCIPSSDRNLVFPLNFSFGAKEESSFQKTLTHDAGATHMQRAVECINRFYGKDKVPVKENPMSLIGDLESVLGRVRKDWDLGTLRQLWLPLKEGMNRRSRSEQHEIAWLNLAGYVLRPGYGEQSDSLRMKDVQSLFAQGPAFPMNAKVKNQWWIFWRRIAGGLDRKVQDILFTKAYSLVKREDCSPELLLLLGSLERADMQRRIAFGQWLSSDILNSSLYREQKIWALTRLANRLPLYGGAECIVRPSFVGPWLEKLFALDLKKTSGLATFFANASRRIEDRELDLPDLWRDQVLRKLEMEGFAAQAEMVKNYIPQDSQTVSLLLGETLPFGLLLS